MKTLQELLDIKHLIETEVFQKYLCKPLREKQNILKNAYDCKTLLELATIKGEKKGIEEFFEILRQIESDLQNKQDEAEAEDTKKL